MSVTLPKSYGFKARVQDDGPDAEVHDVDGQNEVIKMSWVGKVGHVKDIGSCDWTKHHISYSPDDAHSHKGTFPHEIPLFSDSHGHPEFPSGHVHTHATIKIDLNKGHGEFPLRKYDRHFYMQSFFNVGIYWHQHHMRVVVKNPKTNAVLATKDIPYHND